MMAKVLVAADELFSKVSNYSLMPTVRAMGKRGRGDEKCWWHYLNFPGESTGVVYLRYLGSTGEMTKWRWMVVYDDDILGFVGDLEIGRRAGVFWEYFVWHLDKCKIGNGRD